jgi:ribosomal protein S18 acetylase RimI-like enzyme
MFVGRLGSFLIMSEINIREFNPLEDAEAIYNIAKDAWLPIYDQRKGELDSDIFYSLYLDGPIHKAESVKDWCIKNSGMVAVAEFKGEVAGFITWEKINLDTVELCNNAVSPKAHKEGIASTMYTWFLKEMKARGFSYTFVFTGLDPAHEPSRKAYEKVGFSMPTELVRYYKKL